MEVGQRIILGTRKGLFIFQQGHSNWNIVHTAFMGDPVTALLADNRDKSIYAALNLGHFGVKLHRSDDHGSSWQAIATPKYPAQPKDSEDPPWTLIQVWSLEAGGEDRPGMLWAGTIPGGLFRSDDRGHTWHLNRSLWDRSERLDWFGGGYEHPGIHSICVDPRNSQRLLIGISCGGVWETQDVGESWDLRADGMRAAYMPPKLAYSPNIQDPHRLVLCAAKPDTLWIQHHNGIFRSTDGAKSWQELENISPSSFGFTVAVHPSDPDTAWFVPAVKDECRVPVDGAVVVNRTRDGGKSFETLRNGLPQQSAFDLVYRHGMDIDAEGNTIALGSTTGSLWISSDQGNQWEVVSTHMPPIYCVRFIEGA